MKTLLLGLSLMPGMAEEVISPESPESNEEDSPEYSKASVLNRFVAKIIDLIVAAAFSKLLSPVGFFAGLTYLLISDGFFDGRSLGKKLIRLRTIKEGGGMCAYRDSILRNLTMGIGYILFFIPYIGWLLTLIIYSIEGLIIIGNEKGLRIGDEVAKTWVIEDGGVNVVK
ncbi:MAG: RDD family protein [Nitrospirae bacterium]|nr:RDD family protein [Nitrospirota bacterium]